MTARTDQPPYHLALLPPPPQPISRQTMHDVYYTPLSTVMKRLEFQGRKATAGTLLDIAISAPHVAEHPDEPRSVTYATSQTLVAQIYRLVCQIAAKESINIEDAEGIDVRVVLLAYPQSKLAEWESKPIEGRMIGPVVDVVALARSNKGWDSVYSIKDEQGEELLKTFLINQDNRVKIQKVAAGTVKESDEQNAQIDGEAQTETKKEPHYSIALGGTFDHLHIGHKLLLTMFAYMLEPAAQETERKLTIGITGDELLRNKKAPELLESWHERANAVSVFMQGIMDFRPRGGTANVEKEELKNAGPNGHAIHVMLTPRLMINLVEIGDPYGPTITEESISAMVISAETRSGGKAVNDKRSEQEWAELELFEVDVLDAGEDKKEGGEDANFESKISSTSIRQKMSAKAKQRAKT